MLFCYIILSFFLNIRTSFKDYDHLIDRMSLSSQVFYQFSKQTLNITTDFINVR